MCGFYSLVGSIFEKIGKFWKNCRFSGRIWPDWGNTARADMAGLGSIGLINNEDTIFQNVYQIQSFLISHKIRVVFPLQSLYTCP